MKKNIYLLLAFLGFVFPYYFLFQFYTTETTPTFQAIGNLFATPMSAAFNADLGMSVLTVWAFMAIEGNRIKMKYWWVFWVLIVIGLSFALPLFFYFRERYLETK